MKKLMRFFKKGCFLLICIFVNLHNSLILVEINFCKFGNICDHYLIVYHTVLFLCVWLDFFNIIIILINFLNLIAAISSKSWCKTVYTKSFNSGCYKMAFLFKWKWQSKFFVSCFFFIIAYMYKEACWARKWLINWFYFCDRFRRGSLFILCLAEVFEIIQFFLRIKQKLNCL